MNDDIGDTCWLGMLRQLENRSAAAPVGEFFAPVQESLRLRASTRLGYPTHAIEDISHKAGCAQIVSPLFGLSGPVAALPYVYTERLTSAAHEKNTALVDFFDIFNHRAQSLLYRALRKYRFVLCKERALTDGRVDNYSKMVAAVGGLLDSWPRGSGTSDGIAGVAQHAVLPPDALPGFAGLFARRTRTAGGLARMLRDYFRLDVGIRQFTGRWVALNADSLTCIGVNTFSNNQLGAGSMLGRRSWLAESFFCVEIRDPDTQQFNELVSGGALLHALQVMVCCYAGDEFGFHIEILAGIHLQTTARLGHGTGAARLGWRGILGQPAPAGFVTIKVTRPLAIYCGHGPRELVPSVR